MSVDRYNYVYNMDQTSVCLDMNPHSTIDFVGACTVNVIQCKLKSQFIIVTVCVLLT